MKVDGRSVVSVNCNICNSNELELVWVKDGYHYNSCKNCKLKFISPRLIEVEIAKIYQVGFESKNVHKPVPIDFSSYSLFFKNAEKYRANNRLLDVGCFRGDLLYGAKQKKWDVFGVEISKEAAIEGNSLYNIEIEVGSIFDAGFEDNYFDVVSLFDVIEHLTDPSSYIEEINRILRPGGLLYLDTPNFNSINRLILGKKWSVFFPWHLFYFSVDTLKLIMNKNNLLVKKIINEDWGPFSTNNVYLSLNKSNQISNNSTSHLIKFIFKLRRYIKPFYKLFKKLSNIPLHIISKFKINIGSKIILFAEKPSR